MSNAIPFGDWLHEQGDNVFVAVCDGHPDALILIDKTNLAVYRYTIDKDVDGLDEAMGELMRVRASELGVEMSE
jgi:hypothetical protein